MTAEEINNSFNKSVTISVPGNASFEGIINSFATVGGIVGIRIDGDDDEVPNYLANIEFVELFN